MAPLHHLPHRPPPRDSSLLQNTVLACIIAILPVLCVPAHTCGTVGVRHHVLRRSYQKGALAERRCSAHLCGLRMCLMMVRVWFPPDPAGDLPPVSCKSAS